MSLATLNASKKIRFYSIIGALVSGIIILVIKLYAARIANSAALRSDALEGTVNVLAAAFGLGSIIYAEKPADHDHPYGHGKIEYFAAAFEGGLISLAGLLIFIDAVSKFIHPSPLENLGFGLELNLFAGLMNGIIGFAIFKLGKKHHSKILEADGLHLLTDLVTTLALGLGLGLVMLTGWHWLDPVLALGVALFLFHTGFVLVNESSHALLDAENPETLLKMVKHFNSKDPGKVITIHEVKTQQFGRDTHVDMHVVVPEFFSIKEAHDVTDQFAFSLRETLGHDSEVHTHIDPCEQSYCKECPVAPCNLRKEPFIARQPFTVALIKKLGKH